MKVLNTLLLLYFFKLIFSPMPCHSQTGNDKLSISIIDYSGNPKNCLEYSPSGLVSTFGNKPFSATFDPNTLLTNFYPFNNYPIILRVRASTLGSPSKFLNIYSNSSTLTKYEVIGSLNSANLVDFNLNFQIVTNDSMILTGQGCFVKLYFDILAMKNSKYGIIYSEEHELCVNNCPYNDGKINSTVRLSLPSENSKDIKVYSEKGFLIIKSPEPDLLEIGIFNLQSNEMNRVFSNKEKNESLSIDIRNQTNGIYFIQIIRSNTICFKKIYLKK